MSVSSVHWANACSFEPGLGEPLPFGVPRCWRSLHDPLSPPVTGRLSSPATRIRARRCPRGWPGVRRSARHAPGARWWAAASPTEPGGVCRGRPSPGPTRRTTQAARVRGAEPCPPHADWPASAGSTMSIEHLHDERTPVLPCQRQANRPGHRRHRRGSTDDDALGNWCTARSGITPASRVGFGRVQRDIH